MVHGVSQKSALILAVPVGGRILSSLIYPELSYRSPNLCTPSPLVDPGMQHASMALLHVARNRIFCAQRMGVLDTSYVMR